MAQILEITVGASCSGKSTYAEALARDKGFVNINRDDLRMSMFGLKSLHDYKFTKQKEQMITDAQVAMAESGLKSGKSVIISDTNLDPNRWVVWNEMAKRHGVAFVPTYFSVPLKELLERNTKRDYSLPEKVIRAHVERFESFFPDEVSYWKPKKYVSPSGIAPYAYIVDIDGTLAHMKDYRGPFEWSKVGLDEPDFPVINTIKHLQMHHQIIVMSGRDEICRPETVEWLNLYGLTPDVLLMRPSGDYRPDTKIKEELFENHVAGRYNVVAVFDDRDVVVELWREKGIKCFQCERGDF